MLRKSDLLAAVIQRLSDPRRWSKGSSARNADGVGISAHDPKAVSWCLTGAVRRELHEHGYQVDHLTHEVYRALEVEFNAQFPGLYLLGLGAIQLYNDDRDMTHEGLLAVLEKTRLTLVERGE